MIFHFADKATEDLFHGRDSKASRRLPVELRKIAQRKLDMLNAALQLLDLRSPPGNHLEKLKGRFEGKHSIRINEQWRIVFDWNNGAPKEVKILDYH